MTAEQMLRDGNIDACLTLLKADIRSRPSDDKLRVFLAQVHCVLGNWEKALTQLKVAAELDADNLLLARYYESVIQCEALRAEIFAGKRTPLACGEPPEWFGLLVQALQMTAQEDFAAAQALREQAFEQAPALSGSIDDQPFEWIADADTRLGPIVEVMLEGKYFWVPFTAVKQIRIEAPTDLRDLVWIEAHFTWINAGEATGLIPTRYPGSDASDDDALRLARKTDWLERPGDAFLGLGQRMFTTDKGEFAVLQTREIKLDHSVSESGDTEG